ncbi:hypothetical protein FAUST_10007 [Fusarium austroamericanum]|uniref:Uncharacterized protein n=1 Tax=Fusarium austroamericanum TaxID=282268 RepID=A0AAN5Z1N8_FUSAU|nr:hypothetical protein FAUST_10007 [Fusarium austroamericanum]
MWEFVYTITDSASLWIRAALNLTFYIRFPIHPARTQLLSWGDIQRGSPHHFGHRGCVLRYHVFYRLDNSVVKGLVDPGKLTLEVLTPGSVPTIRPDCVEEGDFVFMDVKPSCKPLFKLLGSKAPCEEQEDLTAEGNQPDEAVVIVASPLSEAPCLVP